jgi:hypothetical protein
MTEQGPYRSMLAPPPYRVDKRVGCLEKKHLLYVSRIARGREEFARMTGAEMSETAWAALQERIDMQWMVLVAPRTLEHPAWRADFHIAAVRVRGRHPRLRGQEHLPPGEARAQIVFPSDPFFPEHAVQTLRALPLVYLPILVDLWPEDH